MVISNITFTKNTKQVILSADISFRGKKLEHAYIAVDKKYEKFVTRDASPFLAAVLLPCMKTGENIYVDGSVSSQFFANISAIMKLMKRWNVGLKRIKIRCKITEEDTTNPKYIGSFFTAGVDSFYTYIKHQTKKREKISHLILVHGFDIPLQNESFFRKVKATVNKVATEEKVKAIFLETNIGEIVEKRLVWDFAHGGALASIALFLRGKIKKVFIPGAVRKDQLFPYGTHPDLNILWSTEKQTVLSDGEEYDRIDKITKVVGNSPLALKYLRVCTQNIKGKYNCSRCFKCLMTMMYLVCADALSKAKTFDKKLDLELVKKMYYDYALKYNIQGERALSVLRRQKKELELQKAITYSLKKSEKPKLMRVLYKSIAKWDQVHNDRRLYQYIFQMNKKEDRNIIFKFLFQKGVLK